MAIFTRVLDSLNNGKIYHRVKVTVDSERASIRCQSWGFKSNGQKYSQIELSGKGLSYAGMEGFARYADNVYYGSPVIGQSVLSALESIKVQAKGLS